VEAIGLFRTAGADKAGLFYEPIPDDGVEERKLLDTKDVGLAGDLAVSPKLTIAYDITDSQAIEASYFGFGIMNWETRDSVYDPNALSFAPFDGGFDNFTLDFDDIDIGKAEYRSELNHNAEISYRHTLVAADGDSLIAGSGVLGGVRYMNVDEDLKLLGSDPASIVATGTRAWGAYKINTSNDMIGGQIGGVLALNPHKCVRVELTGKAALMANMMDKTDWLNDPANLSFEGEVRVRNSTSKTGFAFIGDLSAKVSGKVHENIWLTAGYNALFVTGLALAPEQLDWSELRIRRNRIETGDAIYHGFTAGLTIKW
jgi:hypothetical protein